MPVWWNLPVVLLTGYAAWTDYQRQEIDNWIPVVVFVYGIILNVFVFPLKFKESFVYMLAVFAILFTIYTVTNGGLGGGDVKLLTALAFFYGNISIAVLLIAGITAFVHAFIKGIKDKTYFSTQIIFGPSIFLAVVLTSIFPLQI
ncbi:prepilin peptidase [Caldanaerobacter subterraneus]|uniref:Leader peptidase (Prepilin peptidase)/N-methyltransferase n=1 Tax=Caldanaerobacter subterraneus TaxID=911092 RepID=A0A4R2KEB7_9THEO|nr:A24 family peptidase [Caldanaerobacter subterraneus]TCO68248.1 leader peptidase (prepilin peptidase)/N-methyltransferase [Caldanaerobacter subterraneus]